MKKGFILFTALLLLTGCGLDEFVRFYDRVLNDEAIIPNFDENIPSTANEYGEVTDIFIGLDEYVQEADFNLISNEYKEEEYRSFRTEKLFTVPQQIVLLEDKNTGLQMRIVINTDFDQSFFVSRANYTRFDDTIKDEDIDKAFIIYIKTNEFLFEGVKDHPDYKESMISNKKFLDKNRGKFLDSDSLHESIGEWEYAFSGTLDDAAFLNRGVINEEIRIYDTTK